MISEEKKKVQDGDLDKNGIRCIALCLNFKLENHLLTCLDKLNTKRLAKQFEHIPCMRPRKQ